MKGWRRDRALVKRLSRGSEEAYRELFDDEVPRLYRFAVSRLGGDAATAEDVVQATLVKAMSKLHTYRGESALLTWLTTFCLHEISRHYRRSGRRRESSLSEEETEILAAVELLGTHRSDPEAESMQREVRRLVFETLDRLPPRQAEALRWKYLEGLPMKEIAARWDVPTTTVQSVLQRGRASFRERFGGMEKAVVLEIRGQ